MALDLATRLGWCCAPVPMAPTPTALEVAADRPPQPAGGIYRVGKPGCSVGAFLSDYGDWFDRKLAELKPVGVIYEAPILPNAANHSTTMKLMGLAVVTEFICHRRRIAWGPRTAQPASVKKHFTGNGFASKEAMVAACMNRGWSPLDDNHGDAMAVWVYGCQIIADERRRRSA